MSNELRKCQILVNVSFIIDQYFTYNNYPINAKWNAYWVYLACSVSGWNDQVYVIISWQTQLKEKRHFERQIILVKQKNTITEDDF